MKKFLKYIFLLLSIAIIACSEPIPNSESEEDDETEEVIEYTRKSIAQLQKDLLKMHPNVVDAVNKLSKNSIPNNFIKNIIQGLQEDKSDSDDEQANYMKTLERMLTADIEKILETEEGKKLDDQQKYDITILITYNFFINLISNLTEKDRKSLLKTLPSNYDSNIFFSKKALLEFIHTLTHEKYNNQNEEDEIEEDIDKGDINLCENDVFVETDIYD